MSVFLMMARILTVQDGRCVVASQSRPGGYSSSMGEPILRTLNLQNATGSKLSTFYIYRDLLRKLESKRRPLGLHTRTG
ncbi:hypothetical protein BC629DRAFT_1475532 [Irpex lacteus]|nr:hypothetical protein BC629DRAFT_1475532 [Irpex lacteus]